MYSTRGNAPCVVVRSSLSYERGTSSDRLRIMQLLWEEKMNPLGILVPMEDNFVVARYQVNGRDVVGAGQLKPLDTMCFELSSLVVAKEVRGQGIGGRIVTILLDRAPQNSHIYLVTVEDRENFYSRFGFAVVDKDIPMVLRLEVLVGTWVARMVTGLGLIVMCFEK